MSKSNICGRSLSFIFILTADAREGRPTRLCSRCRGSPGEFFFFCVGGTSIFAKNDMSTQYDDERRTSDGHDLLFAVSLLVPLFPSLGAFSLFAGFFGEFDPPRQTQYIFFQK